MPEGRAVRSTHSSVGATRVGAVTVLPAASMMIVEGAEDAVPDTRK